jgi:hypothetical protein
MERSAKITSTAFVISGEHSVGRVPSPLPRVGLFSRYRALDDYTAMKTLYDPSHDLASSLIVHTAPSFPSAEADAEPRGDVAIVEDDAERVTLKVRAEQPSLVLLNDTFNGGWRADVDGQPARVLRANYAFRAVEVPLGEHTVRWVYHQKGLDGAIVTSLAALAALAILGGWVAFHHRRASQMNEA